MKLFKKALVATAIFGAIGAQAADVSDATQFTSSEGFSVGNLATLTSQDPGVRVIVREQLEAGDRIKLQFGAGLDFEPTGGGFAGVNLYNSNTGTALPATGVPARTLGINTGSGTYELEEVPSLRDVKNGVVVLEVKTGFTIEKDESFEVIPDVLLFDSKATTANATVTYSATKWQDGTPKDTTGDNTGSFLKFATQYSAKVSTLLDGVIEREDQLSFISGNVTGDDNADTLKVGITDNASYIAAATGANVSADFVITGDFSDLVAGDFAVTADAGADFVNADLSVALAGDKKSATVTVVDTAAQDDGIAGTFTLRIDNATRTGAGTPITIKATSFTIKGDVDFDGAGTITDTNVLAANTNAGQWVLDATIINIPYFPVGFEGVNSQVNFANESGAAVDVNVTAIDGAGVQYSGSLADLAKYSTTKVSQVTLMAALKDSKGNTVPAGSKLSVTFNIDADDGKVNAYAFSEKVGLGRQSLVTSQQKGIK
ncbi:hypothetical protein [Pseudoalteromonas peptidolytica]|uniref:Calx-beta domain-containing protein n=1 Tax=Pseudoalteromonas peptidolytica F12-50-A1 TaxID=1315280 RepID=A0A8I0MWP2_9GAMM|nr:hypothetical protein [Pseudoalteromonas peptidolytica]MBE0347285.1 hypothetical protein [Pseudoalteromonas peptidolytica F12-50-A1]NLR13921.1 hypothetical protein [Pseudoalteromonas peptidolytica]GEK08875.1 hypothetical protein PPE03_11240 [Pseudoalteromonas peptidolytica]